ncbi:MAG: metallophosphoesterase [Thermomicrobiales bacterium]
MSRTLLRLGAIVSFIALVLLAWQGTAAQDVATATPAPTAPLATDTPPPPTNTPLPTNTSTPIPPTNTPIPTPPNTVVAPTKTPTPTFTPIPPTAAPTSAPKLAAVGCWAPFTDDFESGSLSTWTSVDGLTAQTGQVYSGAYAALAQSAGTPGYARRTLSCEQSSIYYRVRFKLISKDATTLYLIKLRTTANASIGGIFITENGRLAYRNDNAAAPHTDPTTIVVSTGVWHEVQLHGVVDGATGQIEVWYDGQPVSILTKGDNLGTALTGRVQLGDNNSGRNFAIAFDDVCVDTSICPMISSSPPSATNTPTPVPPTSTATQVPPTSTATATSSATPPFTPTNTSTATPVPSNTPTPTSSPTAPTSTVSPTPPSCWSRFVDDFESGTLAQWPSPTNLAVQQTDVDTGAWAVSAVSAIGTAAYGRHVLTCDQMSVYGRVRFKIVSKDATSPINLLRFRTGTPDASIGGVYVDSQGRLAYRSDAGSFNVVSASARVTNGAWHTLEVHFDVAGQLVEIWYDGAPVADLSAGGKNLGAAAVRRVQLGENNTGRIFDVRFDNVCVDIVRCPFGGSPTPTPTSTATPTSTPTVAATSTATFTPTPTGTPPTCWSPFFDGFESGSLAQWTSQSGLTVQQTDVDTGAWAASGISTAGTPSYARRDLSCDQMSVYFRTRFKIVSKDATSFYPLKFRTRTSNTSLGGVFVDGQGRLSYRSDVGNVTVSSTTTVTNKVWHALEMHFDVAKGAVDVWYDGAPVAALTTTGQDFGVIAIGRAQLGDNSSGHNFDIRFDNVCVDIVRCPATIPNVTPTPTPTATPAPTAVAGDAVIMAAGDIACGAESTGGACVQSQTSDLLVAQQPNAVLLLGDDQYECGQLGDFNKFFGPTWGRVKSSIYPAVGNHEYNVQTDPTRPCYGASPGAPDYWSYFGVVSHPRDPTCGVSCTGYYSFDVGAWHIIAINSNCSNVAGGCSAGSAQEQWLRQDLAAHPNACTLAYWHHARFSSGQWQNNTSMQATWQALYDNGAEVVLNGHDHNYEQFAPQDGAGNLDQAYGMREFVVGTGGRNLGPFTSLKPNSEVFNRTSFGVLKMTLHPSGYDWQFVSAAGSPSIPGASGSAGCHGRKTASLAPAIAATTGSSGQNTPALSGSAVTQISLALGLAALITFVSVRVVNVSAARRGIRSLLSASPRRPRAAMPPVKRGARSRSAP